MEIQKSKISLLRTSLLVALEQFKKDRDACIEVKRVDLQIKFEEQIDGVAELIDQIDNTDY
jgi:hypothetical protein